MTSGPRENGLVPVPKQMPRGPTVHGPAASHYLEHHSCELCENRPAAWLWEMRMGSSQGMVAICAPCARKVEQQGYFTWQGMKILVLNDETPPGVADVVAENYSPSAAKWIRGRERESGQ